MPVTIVLRNRDDVIPHNIAIAHAVGQSSGVIEVVSGGVAVYRSEDHSGSERITESLPVRAGTVALQVPPLPPGVYSFVCTVHPQMRGTYRVR